MPLHPWEDHHAKLTPEAFGHEVVALLAAVGKELGELRVVHQERIETPDGAFRMDATVRFQVLNGAELLLLIECKDHARPVERKDVQVLADRLRAANAHKGLLFATNGFQKGAIEFAVARGIALVRLVEGELLYETRSYRPPKAP